jgi:hypothetical protein
MIVSNAWWSSSLKFINGILDFVAQLLNKVTDDEEAGTVEAVMTMYADKSVVTVPTIVLKSVNQLDECAYFVLCWGLF